MWQQGGAPATDDVTRVCAQITGDVAARTPSENAGRLLVVLTRAVKERLGSDMWHGGVSGMGTLQLRDTVRRLATKINNDSLIVVQLVVVMMSGTTQMLPELVAHTFEAPEPVNIKWFLDKETDSAMTDG